MNIRQKYELKMLAVDGYVNMTKVAEMFSINLRTVRYDIGILNEFLLRELGRECIFVTNKTAQVDGDVKGQLAGLAEVGVKDFYTDRLTGEERMLLIVFDLCWSNGYSTIQDIADKYFVSRTTVNADMVEVKEYCRKNGINLISQRGKGLCIDADEVGRRKYLSKVIRDFTALTGDRTECDHLRPVVRGGRPEQDQGHCHGRGGGVCHVPGRYRLRGAGDPHRPVHQAFPAG